MSAAVSSAHPASEAGPGKPAGTSAAEAPRAGDSRVFDGMEFAWVPAGEFLMGSDSSEAGDGARGRPVDGGVKHRRQDLLEREGVDAVLVERRAAVLRNLLRAGNRVALVECAADHLRRSAFDEVPRFAHASGMALPQRARGFPATALGMLLVLSAA